MSLRLVNNYGLLLLQLVFCSEHCRNYLRRFLFHIHKVVVGLVVLHSDFYDYISELIGSVVAWLFEHEF